MPKQLAQRRQWELRSSSHCSACAACSPGRREDSTARHLQLRRSTLLAPAADNSWPPSLLPACLQVVRLSSQDVPTSYAYELEAATIVQPEKVVAAVHKMCGARGLVSA